jgi:hypothetical protein
MSWRRAHLGTYDQILILSEFRCVVFVGRPLWWLLITVYSLGKYPTVNRHIFHVTRLLAQPQIRLRGHARPTVASRDVINRRSLGSINNLISTMRITQIPKYRICTVVPCPKSCIHIPLLRSFIQRVCSSPRLTNMFHNRLMKMLTL